MDEAHRNRHTIAPLPQLLGAGRHQPGLSRLRQMLKDMERTIGSTPTERKQGIVRIDIDILLADGQRHHEDDWERPYVKNLLAQL